MKRAPAQPILAADKSDLATLSRIRPAACCCWRKAAQPPATSINLCEATAIAGGLDRQSGEHSGPGLGSGSGSAEHGRGADRALGADLGAVGEALLGDKAAPRTATGARGAVSAALLPRAAARGGHAGARSAGARRRAAGRRARPARWPHPIQFLTPKTSRPTRRASASPGETLTNPRRIKRFGREQYFKTRADGGAVRRPPSALANSVQIAQRCNLDKLLGKPQLPNFPTPEVDGTPMPMADFRQQLSHEGLEERLARSSPTPPPSATSERPLLCPAARLRDRTILKMGFPATS